MSYVWLSHRMCASTPLYGGEKGLVKATPRSSIATGDSSNTLLLQMTSHSGTHVDAPRHFLRAGRPVDSFPAGFWITGKARVAAVKGAGKGCAITPEMAGTARIPADTECLLIRTGFSSQRGRVSYWRDSPYITERLARELKRLPKLRFLGVDFISVSNHRNREEGRRVHRILLGGRPLVIIEDMDLSPLKKNVNELIIVPLRVRGADGGPCGVIAKI